MTVFIERKKRRDPVAAHRIESAQNAVVWIVRRSHLPHRSPLERVIREPLLLLRCFPFPGAQLANTMPH